MFNMKFYIKNLSNLLLLSVCILLSACKGECIDADDFGFQTVTLNASGEGLLKNDYVQISKWKDPDLYLNGEEFVAIIDGHSKIYNVQNTQDEAKNSYECIFKNNDITLGFPDKPNEAWILNPPCFMRKGRSLYGLIMQSGDPNRDEITAMNPSLAGGITFHINNLIDGLVTRTYNPADPNNEINDIVEQAGGYKGNIGSKGDKLYFKILDNYYTENTGSYKLIIKKGVAKKSSNIMLEIFDLVQKNIARAYEKIFNNIINQPSFIYLVRGMLGLFITFSAAGFILGFIQITAHDLVFRSIKYGIIMALLSPTAWDFFYTSFFHAITDMPKTILGIITGNPTDDYSMIDNMVKTLFNTKTIAKLSALITFSSITKLIISSLFFVAVLIFMALILGAIIKICVSYILAMLAIGLLISIAPFFIIFLLFQHTRYLFQGWLSSLLGFTLQPIIAFSFMYFAIQFIMKKFYDIVGFRICVKNTNSLGIAKYEPAISNNKADILVPADWVKSDGSGGSQYCGPYECIDNRYIDLPYIDLNQIANLTRIEQIFGGAEKYETAIVDMVIFGFIAYAIYEIAFDLIDSLSYEIVSGIGSAQQGLGRLPEMASAISTSNPAVIGATSLGQRVGKTIFKTTGGNIIKKAQQGRKIAADKIRSLAMGKKNDNLGNEKNNIDPES